MRASGSQVWLEPPPPPREVPQPTPTWGVEQRLPQPLARGCPNHTDLTMRSSGGTTPSWGGPLVAGGDFWDSNHLRNILQALWDVFSLPSLQGNLVWNKFEGAPLFWTGARSNMNDRKPWVRGWWDNSNPGSNFSSGA